MEPEIKAMIERNQDNDPVFAMNAAAEALDLLGHYCMDFNRPEDQDEIASICRIISSYLKSEADKVDLDE